MEGGWGFIPSEKGGKGKKLFEETTQIIVVTQRRRAQKTVAERGRVTKRGPREGKEGGRGANRLCAREKGGGREVRRGGESLTKKIKE